VERIVHRASGLKRCTGCGETKPLSEFNKQAIQSDGHTTRCKACTKIAQAERYIAHREEYNTRSHADYRANIEQRRAVRKAKYAANREKSIAAAIAWNRANPDKRYVTTERWRKANMERTREYVRRRYARRKAGRVAPFTLAQLQAKMDYWDNRCHICGAAADTIDHVKPLAKGGLDVLANLRPCCGKCNSSKRDRWPYPLTRNIPRWQ
jgi:5-methylcytosine-specific restriction endonuclease McrA